MAGVDVEVIGAHQPVEAEPVEHATPRRLSRSQSHAPLSRPRSTLRDMATIPDSCNPIVDPANPHADFAFGDALLLSRLLSRSLPFSYSVEVRCARSSSMLIPRRRASPRRPAVKSPPP